MVCIPVWISVFIFLPLCQTQDANELNLILLERFVEDMTGKQNEVLSNLAEMKADIKQEIGDMINEMKSTWQSLEQCCESSRNDLATLQQTLRKDECSDLTHNCSDNANCVDKFMSYGCTCKSGYAGDGFTCEDINECNERTHRCHANASCINNEGSYTCTCNTKFTGDGFDCEAHVCNYPFKDVPSIGCLLFVETSAPWSEQLRQCRQYGGDLFVADDAQHFLRLAQHFIDTKQAEKHRYVYVGVKEGHWLNGRKVDPLEEAPRNPVMTHGTCSYMDGDETEKSLLWTDPCTNNRHALCYMEY